MLPDDATSPSYRARRVCAKGDPAVTALGTGWLRNPSERFYGFGEHRDAVDRRGEEWPPEAWSYDAPSEVPEATLKGRRGR